MGPALLLLPVWFRHGLSECFPTFTGNLLSHRTYTVYLWFFYGVFCSLETACGKVPKLTDPISMLVMQYCSYGAFYAGDSSSYIDASVCLMSAAQWKELVLLTVSIILSLLLLI